MPNFALVEKSDFSTKGLASPRFLIRDLQTSYHLEVNVSPFHNCQIWTLAPFNCLLSRKDLSNVTDLLKEIMKICEFTKRVVQVDVSYAYYLKVKESLNIISEKEYVNLTGSKMVSALIRVG